MDKEDHSETSFLLMLTQEQETSPNSKEPSQKIMNEKHPSETQQIQKINLKQSFVILTGVTFGTGVLVLPFTVRQLGIMPWLLSVLSVVVFLCFCSNLLIDSIQHMIKEKGITDDIRDPYPAVVELAGGLVCRKVQIIFMYVTCLFSCLGLILLSSTVVNDLINIGDYSYNNKIRLWVIIIVCVLTPIMYLGNYSDLQIPAFVAIATSSVSTLAVVINCFLANRLYQIKPDVRSVKYRMVDDNFLLPIGTLVFTFTGAVLCLPNVVVISARTDKLTRTLVCSYAVLIAIYITSGVVSHVSLGVNVLPSMTTTFKAIIEVKETGIAFKVLTTTIQCLMGVHLLMATLLVLNPIYLHLEEFLNVPHEMGLKRVGVRSAVMLFILVICCLIPQFNFIISIGGGVPLTFIGVLFPLFTYVKLFHLNLPWYSKLFFYAMMLLTIGFIAGNLTASIMKLVNT